MYKQAAQLKLRFQTPKGLLSTEQLFGLSLSDLASSIKEVRSQIKENTIKEDDALAFLDGEPKAETENDLRFKILKDVFLTKKEDLEAKRKEAENKEFNAKIDAIIARKQDEKLDSMSIEELMALRKQ